MTEHDKSHDNSDLVFICSVRKREVNLIICLEKKSFYHFGPFR